MGIAEQMGRVLQRTSISVNIKERLDFSCALFSPGGALVANAPHLPVHLGAMSEAVRFQVRARARLSAPAPALRPRKLKEDERLRSVTGGETSASAAPARLLQRDPPHAPSSRAGSLP